MTRAFVLHPDVAQFDLPAALAYYDKIDRDLGSRFLDDYEHCLNIIEEYPLLGRPLFGDYRRRVLGRFPYLVMYRVTDDQLRILALLHGRRDPVALEAHLRDRLEHG